jgi:hypothetical protein
MALIPDNFERSCADFAYVFSLFAPAVILVGLLITVFLLAFLYKRPKEEYMFYVYFIIGLVVMIGTTMALYKNYPGIFCGFFIIYLLSVLVAPILDFAFKQ